MHAPTPPPGIDTTVASSARLYDYFLGGKSNYAVDRQMGDRIAEEIPEIADMARGNRRFLRNAVEHMAEAGIDQFLDIGSGLPAENPVHEVARRTVPQARVVYVDHDPVVRIHAEALLADQQEITGVVQADMREPETIFAHPEVTRRIDLARPVGLLLVAMLHFLTDDQNPYDLVRRYRDRLPPGSYVALSHAETDTAPERAAALERFYAATSSPGEARSRSQIARFFDGLDLVDPPGLVHVADWRTRPAALDDTAIPPNRDWVLGGLGRLPAQPDTAQ